MNEQNPAGSAGRIRNGAAPETVRRFGWKKTLIYSLIPTVVLLGGLELTARIIEIWAPPRVIDFGLGFNPGSRLFVPDEAEPGMMRTNPRKLGWSFVLQRFAVPKPQANFRVFALGGSSVENLGEFEYLKGRLKDRLAEGVVFETINAGGASYGSHRLVPIAAEIMNYEPDLVMIYSGHNEFEELEQLQIAQVERVGIQELVYRFAFFRFLRDRLAWFQTRRLETIQNQRLLKKDDLSDVFAWRLKIAEMPREAILERIKTFRDNITTIVTLCQANRLPVIIGTVPSNLLEPELYWGAGYQEYDAARELFAAGKYEEGARTARAIMKGIIHHQATDGENDAIRSVAQAFQIPLADVEAAVIAAEPHHVPGETLFRERDHCHLNGRGNQILLETFEPSIVAVLRAAGKLRE